MKITILDILPLVKWETVQRAITYHYPQDKNKYEGLFRQLKLLSKKTHTDSKEFIEITTGFNFDPKLGPKFWEDLKKGDEELYYSIHTNKYALSGRKYAELVNIPLSKETLKHYTFEDIIALFIWEITFYGNELETEKVFKEIRKRAKSIV